MRKAGKTLNPNLLLCLLLSATQHPQNQYQDRCVVQT